MKFYLGTHEVSWLASIDIPLFVSFNRLRRRRSFPKAKASWALDSGGFTELSKNGRWSIEPLEYAEKTVELKERIGRLDFASIQDWMCEPFMIKKTSLSIADHQQMTCLSYCELKELAPGVHWIPVLQGWEFDDYLNHLEEWSRWNVDLRAAPVVGLGSVCRRQDTSMAEDLVRVLSAEGINLHLFGFKSGGLDRCHEMAVSSDSMAWSFAARRRGLRLPGCTHKTCSNCVSWALQWRRQLVGRLSSALVQGRLGFMGDSRPCNPIHRCPICWSEDIQFPSYDFPEETCVNCGHEWRLLSYAS